MKTPPLYNALNAWLGQLVPWAHRGHLTTCLWMVVALLQRGEINLTRWLPYVPCRGVQAQRKQRRLSRWLHNSHPNVHRLYKPIQAALADRAEEWLYLSLDPSLFWDEYCLIRLAVVHRGRALPVVWRVLRHRSASVAFDEYREMLHQAAHRFHIGWDWVKAALENSWQLIGHVQFTHNRDPEAAMASRKQHEQRTYRIEFKIHTYCYTAD